MRGLHGLATLRARIALNLAPQRNPGTRLSGLPLARLDRNEGEQTPVMLPYLGFPTSSVSDRSAWTT